MPIITLLTDENNDLAFPDGRNAQLISGEDALVQDVRAAGLLRMGEDLYDTANGVDYMGTVFAAHPDMDAFRVSLLKALTKLKDVLSVESLIIEQQGEVIRWVARLLTIYGLTTITNGTNS